MKRITERQISSRSRWSLRLALFSAQLIIIAILLHRFTSLSTPVATNLIVVSLMGAAIAIFLSILAFSQIWNKGIKGTGIALTALIVSLIIFAVPLYHLPNLIRLPAINDITTDLLSPPQFRTIATLREPQANSLNYPGSSFIAAQARAYPDISTLLLERSHQDSYELIHGVIRDLGWEVVSEQQPDRKNKTGYIEAVDQSMLLGFRDDIVVRVRGDANFTRIDMRSASRYGRHDLGTNANRIRETFAIMKTRIARAEANRIDSLERRRIATLTSIEKKKKARERLRRKKEQEASQGTFMLPKANFNQEDGLSPNNIDTGFNQVGQPGRNKSVASGFANRSLRAAPTARKRRIQKIRRSKRKRRRKKWVPFKNYP